MRTATSCVKVSADQEQSLRSRFLTFSRDLSNNEDLSCY